MAIFQRHYPCSNVEYRCVLDDIKSVYHGKLAASPEELLEACTGLVEFHHVYMLQMIQKDIVQTQHIID